MTASRFRSNLRMLTFLVAFSAVVVAVYVRSVRLVERERGEAARAYHARLHSAGQ